ncbi:unnamed protein product [Chrysoparadoxa australica]
MLDTEHDPDLGDMLGEQDNLDDLKGFFREWLSGAEGGEYSERVDRLRQQKRGLRLIVNLNHLRARDPERTQRLLRRPKPFIFALSEAAKELALERDPSFGKVLGDKRVEVGFEGSLGHQHVSPRGLVSRFMSSLVCVEGIITKCSNVRPKVTKSVHYCPATGKYVERVYRDDTTLELGLEVGGRNQHATGSMYPTKNDEGERLETEYGLCQYKDSQVVFVQEMPERAPLGQLPRSVEVVLNDDLVDLVKPGDRVQMVGVYRALSQGGLGFKTVILANNVQLLGKDVHGIQMTPKDVVNIRGMAARADVLELLGNSLAPAIYGHDQIKQALVLQLLGGEEKNLPNGTHLRGDVNILMVGDPSTAKSQLLRAVLNIAPLAINTTGRGSSGVGLTAAVTTDRETGERRLEAGAMVLADRGVVCIDEFDKMSEADRVAIHEVMEQQTVTIAKAGIHASLNARCSVVGAANPVYGQYDKSKRPQENIGLPDSLLSRFDLLFVVLDQLDAENDRAISGHVLRAHRYRRPGAGMEPERLDGKKMHQLGEEEEEQDMNPDEEAPVWEKFHPLLHAGRADGGSKQELLNQKFFKKYLQYAKSKCHPALTTDAREYIASAYAALRGKQDSKTLPVTARSLETVIRLATAHAKARLSQQVEEVDCLRAMDLMNYALYHETQQGGDDESDDEAEEEEHPSNRSGKSKRTERTEGVPAPQAEGTQQQKRQKATSELSKELVESCLARLLKETRSDTTSVDAVLSKLNAEAAKAAGSGEYSRSDLEAILVAMEAGDRIMLEGDMVHQV